MGILYWEVTVYRRGEIVTRFTFLTQGEAEREVHRLTRIEGIDRKNVACLAVSAL